MSTGAGAVQKSRHRLQALAVVVMQLDCAQNGVNEHEFEQSCASVYKM